ncbi:hypothetical protein ULF88_25055 [Halopseudomonas pachastrellae]|nr:hypothetical protein [Halopseudomonas pachastrellae]
MNRIISQSGLELGIDHPSLPFDLFRRKQRRGQHVGQMCQTRLKPLRAHRTEKRGGPRRGTGIEAPAPLRHAGREGAGLRPALRAHEQHMLQQVGQPRQVIRLGMTTGGNLDNGGGLNSMGVVDQQTKQPVAGAVQLVVTLIGRLLGKRYGLHGGSRRE